MTDVAALLDATLRAQGVPIIGVSLGVIADRTTWIVQYADTVTGAQQATGENIRATFDANAPAVVAAQLDRDAQSVQAMPMAKALCALILDQKLNRRLTQADIPAVQALFPLAVTYYKFIINNGL